MSNAYVEHHPTLTTMEFVRKSYPFETDQDLHRFARFVVHMRKEFGFDYHSTQMFCERSICRMIKASEFSEVMHRVESYIEECTHA